MPELDSNRIFSTYNATQLVYVDAVNGSDSYDGSSSNVVSAAVGPKKTLAAAMAVAEYGDTVIALPGTYDSKTMLPSQAQSCYTAAPTLPARVVVKGGVTLQSRDGAEATVIKGEASASSGCSDGCGDGAVRGVFLCAGATLRGFTVTGGRTLYQTSGTIDVMGGGVCGAYDGTEGSAMQWRGLVENCVMSNNCARSGGGAQYGTYRNCLFLGNSTYNLGAGLCRALAEGCVFKGNRSSIKNHSTLYLCKVVNCTILGGQDGASSTSGLVCNEGAATYLPIFNTIVLGNYKSGAMTNCYFLTGAQNNAAVTPRESDNITGDASVVDADGKPVAGAAVIDAGNNALAPAALLAGRDPAGVRRVLNSTIDIGAYEYDWGVPWGKAVGGKRLRFTDMPSDASLVDGALVWTGGTVEAAWADNGSDATYKLVASVSGNGTLAAAANGTAIGSVTPTSSPKTLSFSSALASNALVFDFAGGGTASLSAFSHTAPMVLIVR
jgi:hypothetical protein